MRPPRGGLLLSLLVLSSSVAVFAREIPVPPPPEVQTIMVTKDVPGGTVVINWSDGVAPFSVERSESPDFLSPTNLAYVTRSTLGGPVSDLVLNDGKTYFYQVSDDNSPPEIYTITEGSAITAISPIREGGQFTINGRGFNPTCSHNTIYLEGGLQVQPTSCSTTQLQAPVPVRSISGSVVGVSNKGTSTHQRQLFAVGLASNPARVDQAHLNVDPNNYLFVCDQGADDHIWRIDIATGAAVQCPTMLYNNPVGLPMNENGKFNFARDIYQDNNPGSVLELNPADCTAVLWGNSGTSFSDPVDPRALAYDKSGANNGWSFVLDHWGDRIRRRGNLTGMDTAWLTGLGLGGDTVAASRPAGLTFNTAGDFFYTAQSTIVQRSQTPPRPIIQTFTQTDGLNHPAQIETDDVTPTNTLWVANRDANNVLRIRTTLGSTLVRTKVTGITSPRGIAFAQESGRRWLYVGDQAEIYRFRRYDTVHLDIKVLNEAFTISRAAMERRVREDFERARTIFAQCDVELVLDGVSFISDPNAAGGAVSTDPVNCTPNPTNEEQNVLHASRSSNTKAINVYYIHHFEDLTGVTTNINGQTYDRECFSSMSLDNDSGVMIARLSAGTTGGPLGPGAIGNTLAHEEGHFLLNGYVQSPGDPNIPDHRGVDDGMCSERGTPGTDANEYYLMNGVGCPTRYLVTRGSGSECENILTNGVTSTFVEPF